MISNDCAKILLVDDLPANLFALSQLLAAPGYEIVQASSGARALEFLLRDECAVILMDVHMPEMDGYETARLIRSNPRTRDIPIVFVTAAPADERRVMEGYESGAIDYLMKPIRAEVLRSKVAGFVALHRARLEIRRQGELLREAERREHVHALAQLELRALHRQEAAQRRYRTLVEGLTRAIVWVLDPATLSARFVSPSSLAVLGRPPEEWSAAPRPFTDLLPAPDAERFRAAVASLRPGEAGAALEHRALRRDGTTVWLETTVRLIAADEPGTLELHGLSADVTDAVEARDEAAFLARSAAALGESLDVGSTLATAAGLAAERLATWSAVEVGAETLAPPCRAGAHAEAGRAAEADRATRALSLERIRAAGEAAAAADLVEPGDAAAAAALGGLGAGHALLVPLAAHGARLGTLLLFSPRPLPARARALAAALGLRTGQAIENALLHEETRRAVRAREEFLSIASHELRTPIMALSLQAKLLEQGLRRVDPAVPGREDLGRRVASMARQAGRLGVLVTSLLDLARIRAARMALEVADCDLAEVVRDVAARFEDELRGAGRALLVDAPEALAGRWDRTRLEQLVSNLVVNAVKHGGAGPVEVAVRGGDGTAVVTVRDHGPGIPQAELTRIFDAFEQGRSACAGGLGLGLYIARGIAHAHGGRITVESASGAGASFRVELPLDGAAAGGLELAAVHDHAAAG